MKINLIMITQLKKNKLMMNGYIIDRVTNSAKQHGYFVILFQLFSRLIKQKPK